MALTIEARRPSWIRARIDGKDENGRVYQAGETRHIEGAHAVSIRAGDAGAVFVGVDGGAARALGPSGAAATRDFAATPPLATPAVATSPARTGPTAAVATAPVVQADAPLPASRPEGRPAQTTAAVTPSPAPAATESAAGESGVPAGPRPDLVQAGQQWLAAYQRRDRDAMAVTGTDNITVSDERSVTERFPAWQSNIRRDLDQVELELTGDTALLTARMTEHAEAGEHVSRVSQIWLRRNGRWRLADVRIIGEARLNQIIR
jgi:ketosteroid isomerase-like protein